MTSSSEFHGPQQQNEEQHQTQSQLSSTAVIFEPHHPSPVKMVRKSASMAHQKDISIASHNNITASSSSAQDTSVAPPNLQNVNNNNSNNSVSVSRRTSPHHKNNNERQEKVVVHSPQPQQQQKHEQRKLQGPFTVRVDPRSIAGNIKVTHNNSIHSQQQSIRKKSSGPSTSSRTNTRPQLRTKTPPVSSSGNHKNYVNNNNNNNNNRNEINDPNVIHQNNNHQPHVSSSSSLLYPPPFRIGASHTLHSFEQLSHRKKSPEEVREEIHEQHQHSQQLKMKGDRYFDAPQRRGPSPRELAEQKAFHSKLLPPGSSWTSSPPTANKMISKKSAHHENNFECSTSDEEIVEDVYSRLYPKRLTVQPPMTMNNKQQHHQENQNPKSHHTKSAPVVVEGDYYEPSGESSDSLEKKQKQQRKGRNLSAILIRNTEKIDEERVDDDDDELYNDEELLEVQEELMELQALLNDQQAKLKQKLQQRINELKSSKKIKTGNQTKNDRETEQRFEPVVVPSNISRTGRQITERKVLPNSAVARTNSIRSHSGSNKSDDSNRKITNQKLSEIPPQPHTPGKTLPSCNNNGNDRASKSKFIDAEVSGRALNYYPLGLVQQQLYPPHQKSSHNNHQPRVSKPQMDDTTKNTSSSSSPFANKKLNHQNYPNNSMSGATPMVMNHFYFSGNANSGNKKRTMTPPPSIHSTKKTDYSNVKSRLFEATASSTRKTKESNKNDDEDDNTNLSGYHYQQQQQQQLPVQKFKMHFKTSNPQNSDFARKDSSFKRSQTTPPPPASDRSGMKQKNVGAKNKNEDEEEKDFNPELFASASMFHRSNINTSSFSRTKSAPTGASGSRTNNNSRQQQSQQNMTSQRGVPSQPPVFADHVASRVQQIWQDKEQQKPEQQQQQQQKQSPSSSFNKSKNQTTKTSNSKREQQPNFWNSARNNENSNPNDDVGEVEVQRPFRAGRERRVNTPPPTLNRNNSIIPSSKNGSGSRTGSASSRKSDSNRSDAPSANFVQLPIPHTPGMPNNKMNISKSQSDSHLSRIKPVKVATRFYRKEEIDLDDDEDDSSSIHVSNTKNGSRYNSSSRNRDDIIQGNNNNNNTNKNGIIVDVIPPQPKTPGMVTKQSNNQNIIKSQKNDFHARNERNENFFTDNNQQRSTQKQQQQQHHQKNKQAPSPTVDHSEGTKKKNSPNIVIYEKFPASKTNNKNSNTRDPMLSSTGDEFALPREGIQIPRPTTPPPPRPKRQQSDQLYGYSHEGNNNNSNNNNRNGSLRSHANVSGFGIASASANSIAFPIAPLPPTNISPAPHWTSEDHNNNNHNHINSSTPGHNNNKREIVNVAELVEALSARRGLNRQQQRSGDGDDDENAPSPNPVDPRGLAIPEPSPNNHQTKHVEQKASIHKNAKIDDKKHEELVKHGPNSPLSSRSSSSTSASTEKTNNSTLASQSTVSINDLIAAAANDLGVPSGPMVENKNTSHPAPQANHPKLPVAAAAASIAFEPHSVHPKSPLPRRGVATASQQEKQEKEETKKIQTQSENVDAAVLRIPTDEERKRSGDGIGEQQESVRPIVEEVDEDVDDEELGRRRAARQKSKNNNNDDNDDDSAGNDEVDRNTQDERLDAARKVQASQKNYQNHGNLNAENLNINNNTSKNVGQEAESSKKKSPSSDPLTSRVLAYDDGVF